MKYPRLKVLEGSRLADQEAQASWTQEVAELDEKLHGMVDSAKADWRTLLARVEEKPDNWAPTISELAELTKGLGLPEYDKNQLKRRMDKLIEQGIPGPSDLTVFLETIDEEYVTESGIRASGIDCRGLGRFIVAAAKKGN